MANSEMLEKVNVEAILQSAIKLPLVKIDREQFLRKELSLFYGEDIVDKAIAKNPAAAGIQKTAIEKIAVQSISYETKKVTAISAAAGLPGGLAMFGTLPADITQYFVHVLRIMQKLAYLYGFPEFEVREADINDGTMSEVMIFLGVMFGVQGATSALTKVAELAATKVSKSLAQKALMKTAIYPIVRKVARSIGFRMTKEIFAKGVSKVIPLVGGVAAGTLTYFSFKPCANRLRTNFAQLNLCDPDNYLSNEDANVFDADYIEVEVVESNDDGDNA